MRMASFCICALRSYQNRQGRGKQLLSFFYEVNGFIGSYRFQHVFLGCKVSSLHLSRYFKNSFLIVHSDVSFLVKTAMNGSIVFYLLGPHLFVIHIKKTFCARYENQR